jgi:chemotaxis response regulator CheB
MPKEAIAMGGAQEVSPLGAIPAYILRMLYTP